MRILPLVPCHRQVGVFENQHSPSVPHEINEQRRFVDSRHEYCPRSRALRRGVLDPQSPALAETRITAQEKSAGKLPPGATRTRKIPSLKAVMRTLAFPAGQLHAIGKFLDLLDVSVLPSLRYGRGRRPCKNSNHPKHAARTASIIFLQDKSGEPGFNNSLIFWLRLPATAQTTRTLRRPRCAGVPRPSPGNARISPAA